MCRHSIVFNANGLPVTFPGRNSICSSNTGKETLCASPHFAALTGTKSNCCRVINTYGLHNRNAQIRNVPNPPCVRYSI